LAKINANQKKGGIGAALLRGGREKEVISFVKLWDVVSQASPRLKGQTIQSLLILPIQRVPRYKLLLSELIKVHFFCCCCCSCGEKYMRD